MMDKIENIIQVDFNDEFEKSYLDYSKSVITERALPNSKDGTKPVHLRSLYAMYELGLTPDKPHKKCARIVGDTMGKYHPHGDTSIYDAIVRLSQSWNMRYPLINFHGNNGSNDGDGAAAMRYTEARLSDAGMLMLEGLNKNTVDFIPNFDETEKEPAVLPSLFPQLLANGTEGIAVGMACSFVPHNMNELCSGIIAYMSNKDISTKELMEHIKGPDFPTGALLINKDDLYDAYNIGRGKARLRAKYNIETKNGKELIIFTEIPYGVNKLSILEKLIDLCAAKELETVSDIRDETNKNNMRIVVELKKGALVQPTLQKLFKKTRLEETVSINQLALINGDPKQISLKELIQIYVDHQVDVITRETKYDLDKAEHRLEVVNGILIALAHIDSVIKIIRESSTVADAKKSLVSEYNLSEIQAQAIIDIKLSRLVNIESIKIEKEKEELVEKINRYKNILQFESEQYKILEAKISTLAKKFNDSRRTELIQINETKEKEIKVIEPEDVVVIMCGNEIKRVSKKSYKAQNKNGKGIKSDNCVDFVISTNTLDTFMFFTDKGRMYRYPVDDFPIGTNTGKGTLINGLIKIDNDEKIIAATSLKVANEDGYALFVTRSGLIKKTSISEYIVSRKSTNGIKVITLKNDDTLAAVRFINEKDKELLLTTFNGRSIRFDTKLISATGKTSQGIKGINLEEEDKIIDLTIVKNNNLIIITTKGYGKQFSIDEIPNQNRGGKGVISYRVDETYGKVSNVICVGDKNEDIMLFSGNRNIVINTKDIPKVGRLSYGNILFQGNDIKAIKL